MRTSGSSPARSRTTTPRSPSQRAASDVWVVGGGDLAGQFADAGHLDQVIVSIAPVTLGAGRPLLPRRHDLKLVEVGRNGDFVVATYDVVGPQRTTRLRTPRVVAADRVEDVVGQRRRELLLAQLGLGVGAAAVVQGHHAAVVVGELVGADPEHRGERAVEAHQEAASAASAGRGLGERDVGSLLAVVPPLGRELAALQ